MVIWQHALPYLSCYTGVELGIVPMMVDSNQIAMAGANYTQPSGLFSSDTPIVGEHPDDSSLDTGPGLESAVRVDVED